MLALEAALANGSDGGNGNDGSGIRQGPFQGHPKGHR